MTCTDASTGVLDVARPCPPFLELLRTEHTTTSSFATTVAMKWPRDAATSGAVAPTTEGDGAMDNDTQSTETEALRARVDQLEYILGHVAWIVEGLNGLGVPQGEAQAFAEGSALTSVDSDHMAPEGSQISAACYCGWTSPGVATEAEALATVAPHIEAEHAKFAALFPKLVTSTRNYVALQRGEEDYVHLTHVTA